MWWGRAGSLEGSCNEANIEHRTPNGRDARDARDARNDESVRTRDEQAALQEFEDDDEDD